MSLDFDPDLTALLQPLGDEAPSGTSMRYAPVYHQIREARTEDDPLLPQGEWARPLKKADWREVDRLCQQVLREQSKDLQVALWLTEAWTRMHGMAGLCAGGQLVLELSQQFWDSLHPQPDDGDYEVRTAPLAWANTHFAQIVLLHQPLLHTDGTTGSHLYLHDWQRVLATDTKLSGEDEEEEDDYRREDEPLPPSDTYNRRQLQALADAQLHTLAALDTRTAQAHAIWSAIDEHWDAQLGQEAPSLRRLLQMLEQLQQALRSLLQNRDPRQVAAAPSFPMPESAPAMTDTLPADSPMPDSAQASAAPVVTTPGTIQNRDDAYRLLELAAAYLEKTEPHSPTPYLIKRAVTWGRLPLHELMQEILREEGDLNRFFSLLGLRSD